MVYISMLNEYEKYSGLLKTMNKNDVLLLMYSEEEKQIDISVVKEINNCKGEVIYDEIRAFKSLNAEVAIAYRLGGLTAKYGDITAISNSKILIELLKGTTISPLKKKRTNTGNTLVTTTKETSELVYSSKTTEKKSPGKRNYTKKVRVTDNSEDNSISPLPNEGERISTSVSDKKIKQATKPGRKKKNENVKTIPAEGTFEYEMYRYEALCDKVKIKDFDPKNYMSSLSRAVQDAINDNVSLKEKTTLYFTPNIEKYILKVFKDDEKELFDIIKRLHELDK